jgi:hypothetical protein
MLPFLADRQAARNVLEEFPTGVALWYAHPFFCVLNRSAVQLTGFSDRDFQRNKSLWLSRVDLRDRASIAAAWKKLLTEKTKVACEYRFLPNGSDEEIWIRDVSAPFQNPEGECAGIVSVYTDISGLIANGKESMVSGNDLRNIERLVHDIRNFLHVVGGALELFQLTGSPPLPLPRITNAIEETARLLRELERYSFLPNTRLPLTNGVFLLQNVILRMQDELLRHGIRLKLTHESSLPQVRIDTWQTQGALKRALDFAVAVLPGGGELSIEARQREINGAQHVELQITSHSAYFLEIDEEEVFQPFLQMQKHKAGLALGRETHDRGQKHSQGALFSLLLRTSPCQ